MVDLVERLREEASLLRRGTPVSSVTFVIIAEAADEIERLRRIERAADEAEAAFSAGVDRARQDAALRRLSEVLGGKEARKEVVPMTDLSDLISRLEAASEGSRELDEDIALATGIWSAWLSKYRRWNFSGPNGVHFSWPEVPIPEYDSDTGAKIILSETPPHGWGYEADLPNWTTSIDAAITLAPEGLVVQITTACATPALAIAIAAIRARSDAPK